MRIVRGVGFGIALLWVALVATPVHAACPANPNPVRFVSPPNGSLDVARFPVVSVAFEQAISDDAAVLGDCIRILDRTGNAMALRVRRSPGNPHVAIASPATARDRLDPATDYFIEVALGAGGPAGKTRTRFQTSGLKSVFCVDEGPDGAWANTCDESYWRADPAVGLATCGPDPPHPGNPCSCGFTSDLVLGGREVRCVCSEEEAFFDSLADVAVVVASDPAPGSNRTANVTKSLIVEVDRDLGSSASRYEAVLEDVTHGGASPIRLGRQTASYAEKKFTIDGSRLIPDRRYRIALQLKGASPPVRGKPRLLGPEAHRSSWTFTTWTGPPGKLRQVLPTPRTRGVSFPTHLPPWPRLRLLFDGPLPGLVAQPGAPVLSIRKHDATAVEGFATWYDVDLFRLHLMIYETLDEGQRYEVFCTPSFATAIGDPACATQPIARFTTQVTPPAAGTADVREGSLAALQPRGETWLPVRPTVLNHPFGFKERYASDASGPRNFLGHVMLVPPAPTPIATIDVDESAVCLELSPDPDPRCDAPGFYLAASASCGGGRDCPDGTTCATCPAGGNAGCPKGGKRCRYDRDSYRTGLTDFCREIIDGGRAACSLQDALRCLAGGTTGCAPSQKSRMNASRPAECPTTHALHPTNNCVPRGRVAVRLAPGENHATFDVSGAGGKHWSARTRDFVDAPAPVTIEPRRNAGRTTFAATVPLPAEGLAIPDDTCRTRGKAGDGYVCQANLGACHEATWDCLPAQQGLPSCSRDSDCHDGFRCEADPGTCVIDGNHPAFSCTGGDPAHPEIGGRCEAEWVRIDATWNIWRIWWPHHATSPGSRRFAFAARIAPAAGGTFETLDQLPHATPGYDACDRAADPAACAVASCDAWNDLDYRAQVDLVVDRLRDDAALAPHGVWSAGYHALKGNVSKPARETCAFTAIQGISSVSYDEQDGPIGLFIKLPAGTSPADYRIEGTPMQELASFRGAHELLVRGLIFEGFPGPFRAQDGIDLTFVGNQFVSGTGARALRVHGKSDRIDFSGNYHRGNGAVAQDAESAQIVTRNNVFWQVHSKLQTARFTGDVRATPTLCSDGSEQCVRPACSRDFDCRIPFMEASGAMTTDPGEAGTFPTCRAIDPASGVGTCSHGIVGQGLFMDNVLLDGEGPNNGPWYSFRMQRNHLENTATQEAFDGGGGVAWVSLLDNLSFNATTGLPHYLMYSAKGAKSQSNWLRGVAVENNLIVKRSPEYKTQGNRSGKLRPHGSSGTNLRVAARPNSKGVDAAGLRIVGNAFSERPAASEWGAGLSGGVSISNVPSTLAQGNTLFSETNMALDVFEREVPTAVTTGSIHDNLAMPASRATPTKNSCEGRSYPDIRDSRTANLKLCDNASRRPDKANLERGCGYVTLEDDFRRHGLVEPFPYSPIVDMETFQRHLVSTAEEQWDAYRAWPSYDPAYLDDVLQVRPSHPACSYGAAAAGSCEDPDPDRDLYHRVRDNCPTRANPDQRDRDGDGRGDACD